MFYVGNKSPGTLTDVALELIGNVQGLHARLAALPAQLEPKKQQQVLLELAAAGGYRAAPGLSLLGTPSRARRLFRSRSSSRTARTSSCNPGGPRTRRLFRQVAGSVGAQHSEAKVVTVGARDGARRVGRDPGGALVRSG